MKKLVFLAVSLLAAALLCFFTAAMAQEPAAAPSPAPAGTVKKEPAVPVPDQPGISYKRIRVIKGGNLALIAEKCGHTQAGWRPLYGINKDTLPEPYLKDGVWHCLVGEGRILNLPPTWNYGTLDPKWVVPFLGPKEAAAAEGTIKPAPVPGVGGAGSDRSLWWTPDWLPGLFLILAAFLFILWLAGVFRNLPPIILGRRRDPSRYPAMVTGGLSDDPETALAQVTAAYPGRIGQTARVERGHFISDSSPDRVLTGMSFRDGVDREVYIRPGDQMYRFTLASGAVEYYRQACGNISARFHPPIGWRFVVDKAKNISQPTTTTPAPTPAPAAPEPTIPTAALEATPATAAATAETHLDVVSDGLKEVAITITDEKGTVLSVAVKGHERALPTKLEKANGRLVVFFHRDPS